MDIGHEFDAEPVHLIGSVRVVSISVKRGKAAKEVFKERDDSGKS
jgi:hypothetical protein